MLGKHLPNFASIDGQNVHFAIRDLGWKLDMKRFRVYLRDKYHVEVAYYFIGYIAANEALYSNLRRDGFSLIFKPTSVHNGIVKGNCDAELVLQAMIDYEKYDKALVVTGDGDFYCLVKHLHENRKLCGVLVPNQNKYSSLLRLVSGIRLDFMNGLRTKLEYVSHKKK